ncbi:hypothetical protein [Streptomyces sp. HD]|uniref:hypothetical protein n=1 Tax=Streptomyces sp. HD TaxID=3020892 RepID=UPI00232BE0C2|nr:hypothetical protein [Streptomyces sp. HD]MDC0765891.1 hypothetical protein [Streptomyces sp. HD]
MGHGDNRRGPPAQVRDVPDVAMVVTGVGGTLLIRRAAARQEAGPPREEPRQGLIDLDL